jgi:hypothetical protein
MFDSDPIGRKKSGVKSYKIFRPVEDQNFVIIDLEFDNLDHAKSVLESLKKVWSNIDGKVVFSPQTKILNVAESTVY